MSDTWTTFFDSDYLRIIGEIFNEAASARQAQELWSMLDLQPGVRLLDGPCGYGRLSRPLALLGAIVVGVDQSEASIALAEEQRGDLGSDRLQYLRHDLRTPLAMSDFDVACNIFTSFGYGTEEEDVAVFRTLREAVRPGGRVVVESNHRDLLCISLARGGTASMRLADGTIFLDQPDFDAISGIVTLNWYWSGPKDRVRSISDGGVIPRRRSWACWSARVCESRAPIRVCRTAISSDSPGTGSRLAVVGVRDK